jgi:hypothetical protein
VKITVAAGVSPKLAEDGVYAMWDPTHPIIGKDGLNGGTLLIVREGELFGMKCAPIDDPLRLSAILRLPTVKLRKLKPEDFE